MVFGDLEEKVEKYKVRYKAPQLESLLLTSAEIPDCVLTSYQKRLRDLNQTISDDEDDEDEDDEEDSGDDEVD